MSAAPRRQLGLWVTSAIVIANMIGTGIFISTGFQAASIHDPKTILLAWIVGGVIALAGASCYAELGTMMPEAGGEYVYLREAYHPVAGFMSGWVSLTAGFSAPIAAAALTFAMYLGRLVPAAGGGVEHKVIAIALVLAVTAMHAFDTKIGGRVQGVFTALKVALIVGFIALGLGSSHGDWGHFATQHGGFSNISTSAFAITLMYVSFAYSGWNAAAYIASDVQKPARTLPRALLLGTGVVMALYVLLNVVYFYGVPSDKLAGVYEVGDLAARALLGNGAGQMVTALIALALVSSVSAMVMAGPRVYAAMAADGALPRRLAWHSARGVPSVAVVAQGVLACVFVLVMNPDQLLQFVGFTLAISAAFTVGAVFVMRRRGKASAYRTFGYPLTPIVYMASAAWIAYAQISAHPGASAIVALVLAVGAIGYVAGARRPPRAKRAPLPEARVVADD